jgi:hypothetical protein
MARAAGVPRVAIASSPWFLEVALGIKELRSHNGIGDPSDCEGVVQALMESVLSDPAAPRTQPVFYAFTLLMRSVACAPAERQYARAASLTDRFSNGEPSPGTAPLLRPGEIGYNAFPRSLA